MDQLLLDLFTTAMDGGIRYWAERTSYHWTNANEDARPSEYLAGQDVFGFYADIVDLEDDETAYHINRRIMERGYQYAVEHARCLGWSTARPPHMTDTAGIEDWDYDAGDADMILQLGLWEDVRYG
jgi:hypothetical protein